MGSRILNNLPHQLQIFKLSLHLPTYLSPTDYPLQVITT